MPPSFLGAVVEPQGAPPPAARDHRDDRDRQDPLTLELRPFPRLHLARGADHGFVVLEQVTPPGEARLVPPLSVELGVVQEGEHTGRAPFEQLRRAQDPVVVVMVAEDVGPRRPRRLPDTAQHVVDRVTPVRGLDEPLGGEGGGLQDRVAALRGWCRQRFELCHVPPRPRSRSPSFASRRPAVRGPGRAVHVIAGHAGTDRGPAPAGRA